MPSSTDSWGIEVGANAIKAIRLQKQGTEIVMAEHHVVPYKKVLSTPDIDADEQIRLALDELTSRIDIGKSSVVASVPGHMAFARFAKLPPVEPKKVPDIVKFEAVQQIPFPIEQVEWDYQTFEHVDSPDVEVGIFAITKQRVMEWLTNFHAVGLPVHALTLTPVSVYNAMCYDMSLDDDSPGTILMDIGTNATDLIIIEGGRIWLRTIAMGGHHFTEALVRSFKLSYSKAEKIKREAATSKYARQIFQAMRPVFVDLVNEVQRSLGYYQSLNRDAELKRLVGLGSTFRLPGLQKFLKQQLQMDVSRLDAFQRIEHDGRDAAEFNEQTVTLAPAYGLALQGVEDEAVSCNLLPTQMIRQQVWKAKQPWTIAAAAIIAASAGIAFARVWADSNAYDAESTAKNKAAATIAKAKDYQIQWDNIFKEGDDPRLKIENIRRIIDYRNVWPNVLLDIESAMAAIEPQEELLTNEIDKIQSIPRKDRRQVFIKSIAHEYQFDAETGNAFSDVQQAIEVPFGAYPGGPGGPPPPGGFPGSNPGFPGGEPGGFPGETAPQPTPTPAAGETEEEESKPPTFLITVSGVSPYEKATQYLDETFIKYLANKEAQMKRQDALHEQDRTKNPPRDRPYHILDVELVSISPVGTPGVNIDRPGEFPGNTFPGEAPGGEFAPGGIPGLPGGGPTPGLPGLPGQGTPTPGLPGLPGGGLPGLPGTGDLPGVGEGDPRDPDRKAIGVANFLPKDPLADEEGRERDWKFTITWRIELIRPEIARQAGKAKTKKPANPSRGGFPSASAKGVN